jgi:hypothetical protein
MNEKSLKCVDHKKNHSKTLSSLFENWYNDNVCSKFQMK